MQGGFLGVGGLENKRNISVISMNGGNMNFETQVPYESDEESEGEDADRTASSNHERYVYFQSLIWVGIANLAIT